MASQKYEANRLETESKQELPTKKAKGQKLDEDSSQFRGLIWNRVLSSFIYGGYQSFLSKCSVKIVMLLLLIFMHLRASMASLLL